MTINCKGKLVDLSIPKIMGILNLTPDSFYDGGKYKDSDGILRQVEKMLTEGATFIDIGAYSSRPGAQDISEDEERQRLLPILEMVIERFPDAIISVDSFRSIVAQKAIERGAAIVNDISAGMLDGHMMKTVAALGVPYIMMYMRGTPQTMKTLTDYKDVAKEALQYFSERLTVARSHKINDILIDPGFGFAKNTDQNFELLSKLELLQFAQVPVLAGLSRKSMIYKTLETTPHEALNGTTALHMVALQKGASILRVHDVKEAVECVKLFVEL